MEITRLFDLLPHIAANYQKSDLLASKENGQWTGLSTKDFIFQVNALSYGLLSLGIKKDDKIATISNNRPEWNILDFAMLQIGAIHVPVYPTISTGDMEFILNDAEVKLVFLSDKDLFHNISQIAPNVPTIKGLYTFNQVEGAKNWTELRDAGLRQAQSPDFDKLSPQEVLNNAKASVSGSDVATIIYTSGTTGNPKGVMLMHSNILSNFISCEHLPPVDSHCRALSFLPINHIFERCLVYLYLYLGVSVYYAESIDKIGDNIREVNPDFFSAVPRLIEKVYDKIVTKGKDLTGIKKMMFFWALNLGLRYEMERANGWWYGFQLSIARKLVFSKWKEALGGKIRGIVSGSAALQPRLIRVFWAAGIPILEGYGLTETSPVIAVNTLDPGGCRVGTVGKLIKDVQVEIAEDGEILCKGPNVMKGYYKRPDLTAEAIDKDGWFHTGDIGVLEEGFLKITDRKKEIFKTSGGKYISPQLIENKFKESSFIEQMMVIGENQRFAAALIVPKFAYLRSWCSIKGIPAEPNNDLLIKNPLIIARYQEEVNTYNLSFGKTEQIKKFELIPHEWTVESGDLTPTMKCKRKIILEKNTEIIARIYAETESTN